MQNDREKFSTYRRSLLINIAALSTLTTLPALANSTSQINPPYTPQDSAIFSKRKNHAVGQHIAILIYPQMVMLDMIGPQMVFNEAECNIDLIWKDRAPIATDLGIPITATCTFDEYAIAPDVLLIPGGLMGGIACMNDPQVLDFVQKKGAQASWVTSVCTGSLILAAAGLLKGYQATSHWGVKHLLPLMGAVLSDERVVIDRNRMTGGGVTAGIDFALLLLEKLQGRDIAESVELLIEYAPAPPFNMGSLELAGPEKMKIAMDKRKDINDIALKAVEIARQRLGVL
ncbi:MAG: DJ-1/PfpI family protein [Ottowia sp.]|nr:DJ-1/PfpI family protein [Ottowia sp.]